MGQYLDMARQVGSGVPPRNFIEMAQRVGASQDTTPGFLNLISPEQFGTSLDLTHQQHLAERGAGRELRGLENTFESVGKSEDWGKFAQQGGNVGPLSDINYHLRDVTTPAFDLLSAGNFAAAGTALELLRTGNVASAFKQGAREFANALPGVELAGTTRPTFQNVLAKEGVSGWGAVAGGLALDILLDPTNLIPVGPLAKGVGAVGKFAVEHAGPAGRAFRFLFRANDKLLKTGSEGEAVLEHLVKYNSTVDNSTIQALNKVDQLVSWMQPHERRLFALYIQEPKRLEHQIDDLAGKGIIAPERVASLKAQVSAVSTFVGDQVAQLKTAGLVDPLMNYDFYFNGMSAVDSRVRKGYQEILAERRVLVDPVQSTVGKFMGPKVGRRPAKTLYDRLQGTLLGDIRQMPELDLGNILAHGSVDNARWLAWRDFLENVVTDGRISAKVVDVEKLAKNPREWDRFKKAIRTSSGDTYDVLEVTRKTIPARAIDPIDKVVGGWVLPKPIVETVQRADKVFQEQTDIEKFFKHVEGMNGVWKGWATFGTGFHARNLVSSSFINWLAGVGANYKGVFKGAPELPGTFGLRYLQAAKLQVVGVGHGRLPFGMKSKLDELSQKYFVGGFQAIRPPKILDSAGKAMSWEEIVSEGEAAGVPQRLSKMYDNASDEVGPRMFGGPDSVSLTDIRAAKLDPTLEIALTLGANQHYTPREYLSKVIGQDSFPLKLNRAVGQMVDNNARWALYLDRRTKGATAEAAASAVKLWHFDYRNLTEVEKRIFRTVLPFYSWTRFAVPRMLFAMLEDPARFAKVPKVQRAIESLSAQWGDLPKPDYYSEVLATQLPYIYQDKPLFAQLDLPVASLNSLNYNDVISQLHPFVKTLFEAAPQGGYSFFLDAPIETFSGEESKSGTGLSKRTEAVLGAAFPPASKFLFRPLQAAARGEGGVQAASELTGVRFRPLDVRRVLRARTFERRKLAEDFKKKLIQEGVLPE